MISLRRYTNLAAAIHMLSTKRITLLSPQTWDDRNDAYFMAAYKKCEGAKSVLALCFTESPETYHHWHVYAHGSDGVYITFDKNLLLSTFQNDARIKHGVVRYKTLPSIRKASSVAVEKLPFLKRYPYRDESEFRIIYTNKIKNEETKDYKIDLEWITRVTLSPWMPDALVDSVKSTLRKIKGCSKLRISRSTLISNEEWKAVTDRVRQ